MIIFILLVIFFSDYFFWKDEIWTIDYWLKKLFDNLNKKFSIRTILTILLLCIVLVSIINYILLVNSYLTLKAILYIIISLFCIKSNIIPYRYGKYFNLNYREKNNNYENIFHKLILQYDFYYNAKIQNGFIDELQNLLIWINFRFYLAPLFWLTTGRDLGIIYLLSYASLRTFQVWLKKSTENQKKIYFNVNKILNFLDWIPVRLVSIFYVFLGYGEKTLPIWLNSLWKINFEQRDFLVKIAKVSLKPQYFDNMVELEKLKSIISLTRKVNLTNLVIIILFTIYNPLFL